MQLSKKIKISHFLLFGLFILDHFYKTKLGEKQIQQVINLKLSLTQRHNRDYTVWYGSLLSYTFYVFQALEGMCCSAGHTSSAGLGWLC